MPIQESLCLACGHRFEDFINAKGEGLGQQCPQCESSKLGRLFPLIGGYKAISNNGSSVRPKGAGSRPRRKI